MNKKIYYTFFLHQLTVPWKNMIVEFPLPSERNTREREKKRKQHRDSPVPFSQHEKRGKKKSRQNERINCIIKRKTARRASFSVVFLFFPSLSQHFFFSRIRSFRTNKRLFFVFREGIQCIHTHTRSCRGEVGLLRFFFVVVVWMKCALMFCLCFAFFQIMMIALEENTASSTTQPIRKLVRMKSMEYKEMI